MNDGKAMKDFRVLIFLDEKLVFAKEVRSKGKGRAISNVLTNAYRGDLDSVKAFELPTSNNWICHRGCTFTTESEDHPKECPNCGAEDVIKCEN